MTPKDFIRTPIDSDVYQKPFPSPEIGKKSTPAPKKQHTVVRSKEEIPPSVVDFFKIDPRTQTTYTEEEKIFLAQVLMHEIDEGVRLLKKAKKTDEAKTIQNFSNEMHITHRLDLLRELVEEIKQTQWKPQRVQHSYKARNNQWGAIKTRLGRHPALAVTELGVGYKDCNEDAFLIIPSEKIVALADGMGGHVGGNVASCIAIDFFEYGIKQGKELEKAISLSNDAILARSKNDPHLGGMHPMGCTFAAIQIKHSLLRVAHVGDTKVIVIRDGQIVFQTQDHTQGQQLLQEGLVDNLTAFELNHILNRCLGLDKMQPQRDVATNSITLEPGDRIVLLTDGISDNFYDFKFRLDKVAEMVCQGSLSQAADLLVGACYNLMVAQNLPGGRLPKPDNISLAMVEYRG